MKNKYMIIYGFLVTSSLIAFVTGCGNKTAENVATGSDAETVTSETVKTVLWEETNDVTVKGEDESAQTIFIRAYDDGTFYISASKELPFGLCDANISYISETEDENGNLVYCLSVDETEDLLYFTERADIGGYVLSYNGGNVFYGVVSASEHFLAYEETETLEDVETAISETDTSKVEDTLLAKAEESSTAAANNSTTATGSLGAVTESTKQSTDSTTKPSTSTTTAATTESAKPSTTTATTESTKPSTTTTNSTTKTSTSTTTATTTESSHVHSYTIPVYKTVHHDAVTGTRTVQTPVYKDVPVMRTVSGSICNACGFFMHTQEDIENHADDTTDLENIGSTHWNYRSYQYQEETGEYETVVWTYKETTETYTITEAYDEQVVDYYKCSCGAKKP